MISILLPIFNNEETIEVVLNSLINNINKNDEIIIIDDCSKDNSFSIIKSIIKEYSFLKIIIMQNKDQMGIAYSLNKGIKIASKKYIARIDGDDINFKNRFKFQLKVLKENPKIDLLSCAKLDYKSLENLDFSKLKINLRNKYKLNKLSIKDLAYQNLVIHPTIICKTDIFKNFTYDINFVKSQDYNLWLDMAFAGVNIYLCNTAVICYLNKRDNLSKIKTQLFNSIKARIKHMTLNKPIVNILLLMGSIRDTLSIAKIQISNRNGI